MNQDRREGAEDAPELLRVLARLEEALDGLDRLDLKVVAARLSLVIEEVRGLARP